MKKAIIIIAIAFVALALQAQDYVINKVKPDTINPHDVQLVRVAEDVLKSTIRKLNDTEFKIESRSDTLYNKQLWVAYANAIANVNQQLINQLLVNDTIPVSEINGQYYLNNDTLGFSIQETRSELKRRYDRLVLKFGANKVDESSQGQSMNTQYKLLSGYLNQLKQ